jgi:hypothetical protein
MQGVQNVISLLKEGYTQLNHTNSFYFGGTLMIFNLKKTLLTVLVFGLGLNGAQAQLYRNLNLDEATSKRTVGVRLVDFAKYTSAIGELSQEEAEDLQDKWNRFVDEEYELEETLNLFFHDFPKAGPGGYALPVTAFGELEQGSDYAFIQALAYFDGKDFSVQVQNVIRLDETLFNLNVSLVDRKLVMTDAYSSLKMVFPLGVGSFDEGVLNDAITLLTPRFENAYLDQWTVISERKKPRYFKGKPFIRITTDKNPGDGHTAIGFHVQPNLDTFVRAFDSHGCMRMQLPDLMMLHDVVKKGPHRHLPINVKFRISDESEHPFPKRNKPYKKVLNAGSKENPRWILDRDDLVQTTKDWENSAPINLLQDVDGDTHHEVYDYAMAWRIQERREAKRKACYDKFPYGEIEDRRDRRRAEKDYEDCVKDGRRSRSLRDRVYRWWVH